MLSRRSFAASTMLLPFSSLGAASLARTLHLLCGSARTHCGSGLLIAASERLTRADVRPRPLAPAQHHRYSSRLLLPGAAVGAVGLRLQCPGTTPVIMRRLTSRQLGLLHFHEMNYPAAVRHFQLAVDAPDATNVNGQRLNLAGALARCTRCRAVCVSPIIGSDEQINASIVLYQRVIDDGLCR